MRKLTFASTFDPAKAFPRFLTFPRFVATLRFRALNLVDQRKPVPVTSSERRSESFGRNVFNLEAMRATMSGDYFKKLQSAIKQSLPVERNVADAVASAMKTWAMAKGATHYTHWFQPLTGATAEKHDSFFDLNSDGRPIENFKGSALVQQSPMLRRSPTAASVTPSRPAATRPGTPLRPPSSLKPPGPKPCASPLSSLPTPAKPSTTKPRC